MLRCGVCQKVKKYEFGVCYSCGADCFIAAAEGLPKIGEFSAPKTFVVGSSPLGRLLSRYVEGARVVVHGEKGAGKTTAAILAAGDFLRENVDVVWLSREMSAGQVLEYGRRLNVQIESVIFGSDESALVWAQDLRAVLVVDSLGLFSSDVWRVSVPFALFIARENKSEQIAGSSAVGYDCDAVIDAADGKLLLEKCRWKKSGASELLEF